ncbi:MAG TPA: ATP-binding protein [Polyangiaceae bacterium]|jgi:two-component system NtrC family sensor kinase|nr:ATP-binding protein [Polyangiaceae bacterium]
MAPIPIQQPISGDQEARPRVLVVDDVQANLVAMDALLADLGCDVLLARSGNVALRTLLKHEFAVMLLDVQMPEMDGYEVARYARQNPATRDVPIIFLTAGNNSEDNALRGYGSGAVDFLFKPVTPQILRSKVRIFLELYTGRRQIADAKSKLERSNVELHQLAGAQAALAEEFRRANEELKATQMQLVQSAKMASLGELVAGVAHEINNPLAFVKSHLDTVKRNLTSVGDEVCPGLSDAARERWERANNRLHEMATGLVRISDLVVKLRTFSRLDEGERKVVSVRECVESVMTILGHKLSDNIKVELCFGDPDSLDCYPSLLNQALMNLIANAIDAMSDGGVLGVRVGAEGDDYTIVVTDTGTGIPSALRERVLEPFFTTKPVGQGTGLGLSITYSIVRKHGGTIELRDAEGQKGTAAIIRLPPSPRGDT